MRRLAMVLLAVFISVAAWGGTITSLDPDTIVAGSAEAFITINGHGLGDRVHYSGPAGEFELEISASTATSVTVWVPEPIVATPGQYEVVVLGGTGRTAPAILTVAEGPQPLVIFVPDFVQAEAEGPGGATATFTVSAAGGQDPNPVITCNPPSGSTFALGYTNVTCTATNSFGDYAEGSFNVIVQDQTPPAVSVIATPASIFPANKKMVAVSLAVTATDLVDASPDCSINSVTSSQDITGDVTITGALTLDLRAERSSNTDRVYEITVQCIDDFLNYGYGTVSVTVTK
ncbi:MAG TPA: hypothetical protein VF883_05420 [Thermoanaerobaculia bacterium]